MVHYKYRKKELRRKKSTHYNHDVPLRVIEKSNDYDSILHASHACRRNVDLAPSMQLQ